MPFYVNTKKPDSSREIARLLGKCIKRHKRDWTEIVFLCIGIYYRVAIQVPAFRW